MDEAIRNVRKPRGRSKTIWITTIIKQLESINIDLKIAEKLAQDRKMWINIILKWEKQCEGIPS